MECQFPGMDELIVLLGPCGWAGAVGTGVASPVSEWLESSFCPQASQEFFSFSPAIPGTGGAGVYRLG